MRARRLQDVHSADSDRRVGELPRERERRCATVGAAGRRRQVVDLEENLHGEAARKRLRQPRALVRGHRVRGYVDEVVGELGELGRVQFAPTGRIEHRVVNVLAVPAVDLELRRGDRCGELDHLRKPAAVRIERVGEAAKRKGMSGAAPGAVRGFPVRGEERLRFEDRDEPFDPRAPRAGERDHRSRRREKPGHFGEVEIVREPRSHGMPEAFRRVRGGRIRVVRSQDIGESDDEPVDDVPHPACLLVLRNTPRVGQKFGGEVSVAPDDDSIDAKRLPEARKALRNQRIAAFAERTLGLAPEIGQRGPRAGAHGFSDFALEPQGVVTQSLRAGTLCGFCEQIVEERRERYGRRPGGGRQDQRKVVAELGEVAKPGERRGAQAKTVDRADTGTGPFPGEVKRHVISGFGFHN